jgi:uncharacterized protein
MNIPLIKLYNLCTGYYFYDVGKNCIIKVNQVMYNRLHEICKIGVEAFIEKYENTKDIESSSIKELISENYLSTSGPAVIRHPYTPYIREYINKRQNNLLLQVTQNCNFKCEYCPYSGGGVFDRTHRNISMSWDVAKAAGDLFVSNSSESKKLVVGFYGGEPLIEFDLIKHVIDYTKHIANGKDISFGITTNGYLLDESKIRFLKEHNISLVLSIDGPPTVHNKNRKLASTGGGTFEKIYTNVRLLNELDMKFGVNAVWDYEEDFLDIVNYFKFDPAFKMATVNIEPVVTGRASTGYTLSETAHYQENIFTIRTFLAYLGLYGNVSLQQDRYVIRPHKQIADQLIEREKMPSVFHHGGPCIPGYLRLFIDVDGRIFPCEKVSGKSAVMCIGNIVDGFDYEKIESILNIGKLSENECRFCWAMNLCGVCGMWADTNTGTFSKKSKLNRCDAIKKTIQTGIKNHIILSEIRKEVTEAGDAL